MLQVCRKRQVHHRVYPLRRDCVIIAPTPEASKLMVVCKPKNEHRDNTILSFDRLWRTTDLVIDLSANAELARVLCF
jgi:hypothetical protein